MKILQNWSGAGLVSPNLISTLCVTQVQEILEPYCDHTTVTRASYSGLNSIWVGVSAPKPLPDLARISLRKIAETTDLVVAVPPAEIVESGVGLVVTDADSTLITTEVIEELAEYAGTRTEVAHITEQAMRGEIDFATSLQQRVATLAGVPEIVFSKVLAKIKLSPGAKSLIDFTHASGAKFGLISGGFYEVIASLAEDLKIDYLHANRLEVSEGYLTGKTAGEIVTGEVKAQYLRDWAAIDNIAASQILALGDGANDLPMLRQAGLGIAYCAKPLVRKEAAAAISFARLDAAIGLLGPVDKTVQNRIS